MTTVRSRTVLEITEATEADPELVAALARLTPQLSSSSPAPTATELAEMIEAAGTTVWVARLDGEIVATLTLVVFRIPTGLRAWIEDVVVDRAAAGNGIGAALTNAAVDKARSLGARNVDLTSRPSREAANHLYQKLGFQRRDTNVYRLET